MDNETSSEIARRSLRALVGLVDDLTPGQRWTTCLMLALVGMVLGFGLPTASDELLPPFGSAAPAAAAVTSPETGGQPATDGPTTSTSTPRGASTPTTARRSTSPTSPTASDEDDQQEPSGTDRPDPAAHPTAGGVVALVEPDDGTNVRTDEAMARHFAEEAGLDADVVPIGDAFETCEAAAGAAVAIASLSIPADLRACLDSRGVTTISWDDDVLDGPRYVPTRRGAARSLVDTARRLSGELDGRTALVADERLRSVLEPALGEAARAGLTVDDTVWLADDGDVAGLGVDLAGAGVDNVVFATNVERQSTVASQMRLFVPAATFVVLDAADAVVNGDYPATMDGARAVTSVQFPWHPGAEAVRTSCRDSWEQAQVPPVALDADELLRALLWCQHAHLASALVSASGDWSAPGGVLDVERESPVTSVLAPLAEGGYGPALVTDATWSATCGCWSAEGEFSAAGADR